MSSPQFINELRQISWKTKKGADRCIYQSGAIDCLNAINTNDPRPKRAVALGHTTKDWQKASIANRDIPQNGIPA